MRKNAEKMDLSFCNQLLQVPVGSHGFWAHDLLSDPSHDSDIDSWRVAILLTFTKSHTPRGQIAWSKITAWNRMTAQSEMITWSRTR